MRKNRRGARKGGADSKQHNDAVDLRAVLGAKDDGAKLGAKVYDAVLAAMSPPRLRRRRRGTNS